MAMEFFQCMLLLNEFTELFRAITASVYVAACESDDGDLLLTNVDKEYRLGARLDAATYSSSPQ